ncbi:hypothetical protein Mkiyose1665_24540 [Mycobacterium kiyosense]|uniref:Uncharacterized protein n=1 Tax=Mycobacterium kiyosense TaxID=2871094 RepID=A0A9P3UX28_9MYCO|nr:hypothetical protein IWGMT90018_48950 [Mycobacterium kiyosense]BDE15965.1 hypothetical protein MKCMC460_48250 [Mycobacterium sp. 20KCMC460]GLB81799.1 hypothetical protein SRL2020028_10550 [Mycobacterium kiyosense]GLB90337.1 hypothetical protein SRL2020130_31540 [Mycobacterium kiyosense]GLB96074.1 hypothetical protein SRL2020226_28500 [Mycobacterium kiyosense]
MKLINRGLAAGFALTCVAVGLAGPAHAELLEGTYAARVIEPQGFPTNTWVFSSCGPDCLLRQIGSNENTYVELHRQGTSWVGTAGSTTTTIDNASLVVHSGPFVFELTKVG